MRPKDMLTTNKDDWRTPVKFFDRLNSEFGFDLDAASDDENALCDLHFTKETDGLLQDWGGLTVWCNPPYCRQTGEWVRKAYLESKKPNTTVVMLISAYTTGNNWFHECVIGKAEIRFVRGRVRFSGSDVNAPFNSMVLIFGEKAEIGKIKSMEK